MSTKLLSSINQWTIAIKKIKRFCNSKYMKKLSQEGFEGYIGTSFDNNEPRLILSRKSSIKPYKEVLCTIELLDYDAAKIDLNEYSFLTYDELTNLLIESKNGSI